MPNSRWWLMMPKQTQQDYTISFFEQNSQQNILQNALQAYSSRPSCKKKNMDTIFCMSNSMNILNCSWILKHYQQNKKKFKLFITSGFLKAQWFMKWHEWKTNKKKGLGNNTKICQNSKCLKAKLLISANNNHNGTQAAR